MKIAAVIFLMIGLCYLAWDLALIPANGMHVGSALMAILASVFLYQAYELFLGRAGSRWKGIVSAAAIAVVSGYVGFIVLFPSSVFTPSLIGLVALAVFIACVIAVLALWCESGLRANKTMEPTQ